MRQGSPELRVALAGAAWGACPIKHCYLAAQYHRRAPGRKRALVAVAPSILVSVYPLLTRQQNCAELGEGYFAG
jgi:pimeloyl-ACP methyl ester carboxylesterase